MSGKILVLDDEQNYAEMLQELLQEHRFLVDMATKPEDALKSLQDSRYDLLVSDYKMPVMDGADLLQKAREHNPKLPVILVSGLMNTPELVKVANMGVTMVMEKPLDVELFIEHVSRFVSPMTDEELDNHKNGDEGGARPASALFTFPQPVRHLVGGSEVSCHFIQQLWNAYKSRRFLALATHAQAERQTVVNQLADWAGDLDREHLHYTVNGLFGEGFERNLEALDNHPSASRRVIISGFAEIQSDVLQNLANWVKVSGIEAPRENQISFLAFLDEPDEVENIRAVAPDLSTRLFQRLLVLPPLRERLADLAEYTRRYLDALGQEAGLPRIALSSEAVSLLLKHPWTGDHAELYEVLSRCVTSQTGEKLSGEDMAMALGVENTGNHEELDLERFLTQKQAEIIQNAKARAGGSADKVAETLKIESALLAKADDSENEGLLFPDLLRAEG